VKAPPIGSSWVIVCDHLVNGTSKEWNEIKAGQIVQGYVCDACADVMETGDLPSDILQPLSVESANALRKKRN
jgi:hypothetical protein